MGTKEREAEDMVLSMSERTTPRSEQQRSAWGSLLFQMPDKGCVGRCLLAPGHPGEHFPKE